MNQKELSKLEAHHKKDDDDDLEEVSLTRGEVSSHEVMPDSDVTFHEDIGFDIT